MSGCVSLFVYEICGVAQVSIAESNSRGDSQPEMTFAHGSVSQHLLRR